MTRRWGPKVRHYAARTVENHSSIGAEAIITELFILFCLVFFAFVGYYGNLLVLLVLCGVRAVAVLITLFFEAYFMLTRARSSRNVE